MPVTSSVTVCSTWSRGLASMKAKPASSFFARIAIDQKLERAEVVVTHLFCHPHRGRGQPIAKRRLQSRTRRYLHDLLIAALDAAFALPEVANVT